MSSLRPAKIAAALLQLIGGSLAEPEERTGPSCSCEKCDEAWQRNQKPGEPSHLGLVPRRRINPG
jgi:hypothetical protein